MSGLFYKLLQEGEKYCRDNEQECDDVIPLERFRMEYRHRNRREHRKRNRFLDDFQLHQAERSAVDATSNVVRGNHETVLQESDAPRG